MSAAQEQGGEAPPFVQREKEAGLLATISVYHLAE